MPCILDRERKISYMEAIKSDLLEKYKTSAEVCEGLMSRSISIKTALKAVQTLAYEAGMIEADSYIPRRGDFKLRISFIWANGISEFFEKSKRFGFVNLIDEADLQSNSLHASDPGSMKRE